MKTAFKIFITLVTIFAVTGTALAQGSADAATPAKEMTAGDINVYELIKDKGGPVIYPLAVISIVTVVLIFFFFITIRSNRVVSDRFMNNAEILIRKKDYLGLVAQCNNSDESMARITEKAVDFMTSNTGVAFNEVREVAEAEGSRQSGMLNNRISYLSDIGSIATMMGLLGTVIGMIVTFMRISQGNVDGVQQMKVAEGVYPALITTGIGLSIGIVAMIFYSFFRGKVQKYIAELEAAATHIMALLSAQHNRAARQRADMRAEQRQQQAQNQPRQYFEDEAEMASIAEEFAMPESQGHSQAKRRSDGLDDILNHGDFNDPQPNGGRSRTVEGI